MHIRADIDAYFADDLSPRRAEKMRKHLTSCEDCRTYYDQQARLMRALHGDGEAAAADEIERMAARVSRELRLRPEAEPQGLGWRWGWAVAGSVSLALGLLLLVWLAPRPQAWTEVGDETGARVKAKAGTQLTFRKGSRYRLSAEGAVLELARGKVFCRVKPKTGGFLVRTPDAEVRVVGTAFSVDRRKKLETEVRVLRGKVEVTGAKGKPVLVAAGRRCRVEAGKVAGKVRRLPQSQQRSEWDWFWQRLGRDIGQAVEDIGDLVLGE